ncbi:MAG: hypothetical protein IKW35_08085 [Paludibacteraceae bacterium]|nr:hypothetical protein [Paludibacteraceae bacterium]
MKKLTLFLVAITMSLFSFAAQPKRIYAYGLSSTLVDKVYTFSFTANETPTSGKIIFYDATSNQRVGEIALTNPVLGKNEVEIAEHSLPGNDGQQLNWAVELSAAAVTAYEKIFADASHRYRRGHSNVDVSPESDHFGAVYVGDRTSTTANGKFYVYDPVYTIKDANGYTLGASTWGFSRFDVAPDGKVWLSDFSDAHSGLWIVDPSSDLTTATAATQFFTGARTTSGTYAGVIKNNGVDVGSSLSCVTLYGKGANTKLVTVGEDYSGYSFPVTIFNVGKADGSLVTSWSTAPSKMFNTLGNAAANLEAKACEKGVWVSTNRGTGSNTSGATSLRFYTWDGACTWSSHEHTDVINGNLGAGFEITPDEKQLIMKVADKTITIFDITWDGSTPTLTKKTSFDCGFAAVSTINLDYAGNIVTVAGTAWGSTNTKRMSLVVYSNPTDNNTCEVPAKKALVVTKKFPVATPVEIEGVVKRAIQCGEHVIVLTHEADGTPHIYDVTADKTLEVSQTGIEPADAGYQSISDIAVTDDGKLVANNSVKCTFTPSGTSRFYIWNDLAGNPTIWFTNQSSANYNNAHVGRTMAVKGTSSNATVLNLAITTGSTTNARFLRHVINGSNVATTRNHGVEPDMRYSSVGNTYELNASPCADANWIIDGDLIAPMELVETTDGATISTYTSLDDNTLGKKYNGATYLTIRGMHLMVAPYADASGKVAGVKVLDITKGLNVAELKATVDLATPVAATAAATAVKADGNTLTITLVTDATLHTLTTTIEIPEEIVGVVKRAIQIGENIVVLTHEADGTPHIYKVTNGIATAVSLTGVVARDPDNVGDYLSISDIAATEDGKLVACNYVMCQSADDYVDAGYKRGESKFYIWNNIAADPTLWFTSKMSSNWFRSKQGYTMALKGTSANCQIFTPGTHGTNGRTRFSIYNIINGTFIDPPVNTNDYYHFHSGYDEIHASGNSIEGVIGTKYDFNASPLVNENWIVDGEKVEPFEVTVSPTNNVAITKGVSVANNTLGNKYNGATYLTVNGKHLMVAPYADGSGKVAGVRVMDITNGLGAAKWLKNGVLTTPVAATAAATAVKANGNTLTVTLVTDATLHTFTIKLDEAPSATALNPYAYNLSATWDLASKTLTTNYTLNADAKEVYITFGDGNVEYARRQTTGITRGTHTYALTLTDEEFSKLPQNRGLTWNVIVKANKRTQYAECVTNYDLFSPTSIDIDNNPKNKTFGRIIVAESRHEVKNKEGYLSSGYGAGIYVFNPDFTPVANGTNPGYNGGNTFTEKRADDSSSPAYAPRRVRISDDGRIFVTSLNTNGDVLWEVNADNMNTWTKVFTGTQDANKDLVNGSTFVAGPNAGFDVRGSGDDLKLLMLSANKVTYGFGQRGFRVSEYNLGKDKTWNKAPSKAFPHENVDHSAGDQCYFISATGSQVQYDQNGGVWYIQYRGTTTNNQPGLVHFTAGGVEDYKELRHNTNNAGFRFNNDFTKVVIAGDPTASGTPKAIIYAVSKDAAGKPVLTEESFVDMGTVGTAMNDFAWDYANNLYVVGNNKEKVVAYAMPYSGEVTTPCAEKVTILAGWVPSTTPALNPFAYGLSSELIDGGMNLKINYSLNAPANSAQVVIMNGNTDVKTIPCTDLAKGAHSITIPTDDLPMNTDLTWKVVVNGTSEDKVMEYATKHQFYHPSSIDVDNNPENETFGLVLVNEAMQSVKNTTSTKPYISKGFGAGIFAFDPAFENPGKYNGGITFTNTRADNAEATAYAPRRVRISDDGRIFVTSLNTNGDVLWEVNPERMNEWTPIFTGLTQDANKDLVNGSTFVAGPNAGFDVRGSGDKLQLLMLSSNTQAFGLGQRGFRVSEYNLGNNTSWKTAPSKAFPHENLSTGQCYFINPTASQVQYDKDGGVWYIQYRAEATELLPTLVHFNKNGVEDFKWLRDGIRNAAFRFNNDFTKVAISDQQFVNFYTVSKDASGKPVLTWESGFSLATLGNAINDFAWDYANNFYAVSNSNEWAVAYRLPYSGEVTTPAASKHVIRVVYDVVVSEDDKTIKTTVANYVNKSASVELKRDLHLNEWNTLTLPFGMDATQIEEAFGTGTKVAMLTTSRIKAANSVYIGFSFVNQIEAGKPYLINPTKQVTEDIVPVIINTTTQTISTTILDMIPVLNEEAWEANENNFFLGPDAYLYQDAADGVMPPLRAYFQFKGLTSQQLSSIRARVAFGEDEATDLEDLEVTTQEEVIKVIENGQLYIIRGGVKYNIQGQRIE